MRECHPHFHLEQLPLSLFCRCPHSPGPRTHYPENQLKHLFPRQLSPPRVVPPHPPKPCPSLSFSPETYESYDLFSRISQRQDQERGEGAAAASCESGSHPQGTVLCSVLPLTAHENRCLSPCCSVVLITIIFNGSRIFHQVDVLQFS